MCSAFETFRVKGNINQNFKSCIDRFCSVFFNCPPVQYRNENRQTSQGEEQRKKEAELVISFW